MNNFLQNSVFFGVFISIITYEIGVLIKKKLKIAIFNPLLISMAPAKIPARIAFQFFLRGSICSYKGTASATVAGVRKYERYFAPLSYVS